MTPNARFAAAIEILDQIQTGESAEKTLTNWGRANRFAGSKDRRDIRDIVFDILRRKSEITSLGGGTAGRQLVLGYLVLMVRDPKDVFTGEGYAPVQLSSDEMESLSTLEQLDEHDRCNLQNWMFDQINPLQKQEFIAQSNRADLFLRVNPRKTTVIEVIEKLSFPR